MNDQQVIDLINGEIDGTLTPEEQESLTRLIKDDPQIESILGEWRSLDTMLGSVPMVEPPAGLKGRIMQSVEAMGTVAEPRPSLAEAIKGFFEPIIQRPAYAITYAFAIGLLVGFGVLSTLTGTATGPNTEVRGTLIEPVVQVDQGSLTVGEVTADVTMRVTGDETELVVTLAGTGVADVVVATTTDREFKAHVSAPDSFIFTLDDASMIQVVLTTGSESGALELQAD